LLSPTCNVVLDPVLNTVMTSVVLRITADLVWETTFFARSGPTHTGGKREGMPKKRAKAVSLPIVEPNATGVDVGATQVFVAIPPERDPDPVRCFKTFTADLEKLADWLQRCQIRTVAMESTGVYWIPLFQILEKRGIEVRLVNAQHVKNVPGKKTDVEDCQ
jgi:Transposase